MIAHSWERQFRDNENLNTAETYLKLGDDFRKRGKWEEAQQYYQKVIELEPKNWLAHH